MSNTEYIGALPEAFNQADPTDLKDTPWTLVCARVMAGELSTQDAVNHLLGPDDKSVDLVQKSLALLPLVAGTREQQKLCNVLLDRLATGSVDDAGLILSNVWPWLADDAAKHRALDQVERYLRRRRKEPSAGQEPLLLMLIARLDPSWFPRLLARAIEFPYPTDLLWALQHADAQLLDHVLPQLAGKLWLPDNYTQRFLDTLSAQPPEIALRILDENLVLLRRWGKRMPGVPIKGPLAEWVLSRDPDTVLKACGAQQLLMANLTLPDQLYRAMVPSLVKLTPKELAEKLRNSPALHKALGDDDFLQVARRVGELLPDALKKPPRCAAGSIIEIAGPLHDLFHCWLNCQPATRHLPQTARFIDSQMATLILAIEKSFSDKDFASFSGWVNARLDLPSDGHPGHTLLAGDAGIDEGAARYNLLRALDMHPVQVQATCESLLGKSAAPLLAENNFSG